MQVVSSLDAIEAMIKKIQAGPNQENNPSAIQKTVDQLKGLGFGRLRLPRSKGGEALSLPRFFELVIDLAEADSNVAHIFRNHFYFVEKVLRNSGHTQYSAWEQLIASGKTVGSAVGELGTPSVGDRAITARLVDQEGGYRLTAEYFYSTGNLYADFIFARVIMPDQATGYCMVPTNRRGVVLIDDWDGIGQRRTASGSTVFSEFRVERGEVLTSDEAEISIPHEPTHPQLYLTAIIAGIMQRITADAVDVINSRQRSYYHAPSAIPGEDPILQGCVGRLASVALAAKSIVLKAAETLEQAYLSTRSGKTDDDLYEQASMQAAQAKVVVDALAQQAASELFDVGGASAVRQTVALDRHWRNIRTIASHNPALYKAQAIGNALINGTPLPRLSFF